MTELAQKTVEQQTPPLHYYHEVKWRLLAEAPWMVITLVLAVIMSSRIILLSGGEFAPDIVPHIVTLGFLVIPMIIIIASGDADLSSGTLAGLVCRIVVFLHWQIGLEIAILISLLVALAVGLTNGLLIGLGRLKGIFVTFGMSFVLYGLILMWGILSIPKMPAGLTALARSPLILWLWILLVIVCAALMIFTPLGRRPQAGEPGQEPLGWRGLLYRGLPFVFSSFMAWISGILLLSWLGYATIAAGSGYTEIVLLATLLGGTAYYAGTGFVLSGAIALIAIVLFRQMLNLSTAEERVILGALLLIILPITQYYHIGVDCLYRRQSKKAKDASVGDGPQSR